MTRRQLIQSGLCLGASALLRPRVAAAQDDGGDRKLRRDEADAALDRAVDFIISRQTGEGWINDNHANRVALTALSILAMAALGHTPSDNTPAGRAMHKALGFVLLPQHQDREGYFGNADGSRMYGHGIIALMLGEMVGMGPDDRTDAAILDRLDKSIQLILKAQAVRKHHPTHQGGWRYEPKSNDADLSVSVWQAMALRSAKNAGLDVPKEAIDSAVEYLKLSYHSRRDRDGEPTSLVSGFGYQPGHGSTYSTTAAGMLALQVCGQYDCAEVKGAADWMMQHRRSLNVHESWFYYGTYYYAQAMYQRGGHYAEHARREVERMLLPQQRREGAWPHGRGGQVYSTALAVLSLSVKYHYLPIYQR